MTGKAKTSPRPPAGRRSRQRRFISPLRRRLWTVVLVLLLAALGGYWYLTSDARIRAIIEAELTRRLGRTVRVADASFSLFGPVEIHGLEIPSEEPGRPPDLTVRTIVIDHRPAALLRGGFEPTRILCLEPVGTLDVDLASPAATRPADAEKKKPPKASLLEFDLPPIVVREGKLRVVYRDGQRHVETIETSLSAVLKPLSGKKYGLGVEAGLAGGRGVSASAVVSLAGGLERLSVPVEFVTSLLPPEVRRNVAEYGLGGSLSVTRRTVAGSDRALFVVDLASLTAVTSKSMMAIRVSAPRGRVLVDTAAECIWLEDVSCSLPDLGPSARLAVTGTCDGFEPDSSFCIQADLTNFHLPPAKGDGQVAEAIELIRELYDPRGSFDLDIHYDRGAGEEAGRLSGEFVMRQGSSGMYAYFPYRVEQLTGRIEFTDSQITNIDLEGRDHESTVKITGRVWDMTGYGLYEIVVKGRNIPLDDDMRRALDESVGTFICRDIKPRGHANVDVRVSRVVHKEDPRVDVTLDLDGRAGMTYVGFPYDLDNLRGKVVIGPKSVRIMNVAGSHGQARCTVSGAVTKLDTPHPRTELDVIATDVPVDEALLAALGKDGAAALRGLGAGGLIKRSVTHVTHGSDGQLDYLIEADLGGVRVKPEVFPYELTGLVGPIEITPEYVVLGGLRGNHGRAKITAHGKVLLGGKTAVLERLTLTAEGLVLDEDLRLALGPEIAQVWRDLAPGGSVNVPRATLWHKDPAAGGELDYDVVIEPVDARVTYAGFPRTVTGISGRIQAVPGRITLDRLRAVEGKTIVDLSGTIRTGKVNGAELVLSARAVPVDKNLISATAKIAPKGAKHLKPGGTMSVTLDKLYFGDMCPLAGRAPASRPAAPAGAQPWSVAGRVSFKDMGVDVGLGSKTLSGSLTGSGSGRGEALEIDAELALDEILVGDRRITALKGQLVKRRDSSILHIRDFDARAHGGKLAGKASIDLGDPVRYGISLQVRGIDLSQMIPSGAKPAGRQGVKGLLSGRIEMLAVADDPAKRRGAGEIHITAANISKLPILLELLHLVQLQLPGNTSFTAADVTYRLSGRTLIFSEIHLQSSIISFLGSGTLDLESTKIRLTFVGDRVGKLPRLEKIVGNIVAQLFKGVTKQFVEIRTTGTLAKPKTETIPLPGIADLKRAFDRIVNPLRGRDDAP